MTQETIALEERVGCHVSLYKTKLVDGRQRFLAEASFADGNKFLLDHWNLSSLQRMIHEVIPVVQLARDWSNKSLSPYH